MNKSKSMMYMKSIYEKLINENSEENINEVWKNISADEKERNNENEIRRSRKKISSENS